MPTEDALVRIIMLSLSCKSYNAISIKNGIDFQFANICSTWWSNGNGMSGLVGVDHFPL